VCVAAFLSGDPVIGMLLCVPFGLTRGLSVILTVRATEPGDAGALVDVLDHWGSTPWPRLLNALALSCVAVAAFLVI
jgi:hypothetical protein